MKKIILYCLIIAISAGCKEVYEPNISSPPTGYLVMEGFINSGQGNSTITLSRTTKLNDSVYIAYEHNAQVNIESDNNDIFPLSEGVNGTYNSQPLILDPSRKYHVRIKTQDGKEYLSDFVTVKYTPVIDSISWQREDGGAQIYVNTHDNTGNTKYYQWKYNETWEIHSAYLSVLYYTTDTITHNVTGVAYRDPIYHSPDTTIYKCWQSFTSRNIILGSSEKLTTDRIYLPLIYIEPYSIKLSVLYSMELKQYALSSGAYNFYQQMKKNTEQLGSIFDAQPSELKGNIQCVSNPGEIVIGYIDITQEQRERIFISNKQLDDWGYDQGCTFMLIDNIQDSILKYGTGLIPTLPNRVYMDAVLDFYAAINTCVDCTTRGSNVRPSFWP